LLNFKNYYHHQRAKF